MDKSLKMIIASNIAHYRKAKKMTQADLADCLSVRPTTVSTWERGASLPDAELLFSLCSVLDVSLSTIYGSDAVSYSPVFLDRVETQIISAYRSAPESRREAVRVLLEIKEKDGMSSAEISAS